MKTRLSTIIALLSIRAFATAILGDAPTNTVVAVASDLALIRTEATGYAWVTNSVVGPSSVTLVNDVQKPHRINGVGSVPTATPTVSFRGFGANPVLLEVSNCAAIHFPPASTVFGGTFQTNRVNCFAVWMGPTGAPFINLFYAY